LVLAVRGEVAGRLADFRHQLRFLARPAPPDDGEGLSSGGADHLIYSPA
jgi:hypothetical protein